MVQGVISRGKVTSESLHMRCIKELSAKLCVLFCKPISIVTCCGITHSINVRTVTTQLALETPQGHQDKGKHKIFALGHF